MIYWSWSWLDPDLHSSKFVDPYTIKPHHWIKLWNFKIWKSALLFRTYFFCIFFVFCCFTVDLHIFWLRSTSIKKKPAYQAPRYFKFNLSFKITSYKFSWQSVNSWNKEGKAMWCFCRYLWFPNPHIFRIPQINCNKHESKC